MKHSLVFVTAFVAATALAFVAWQAVAWLRKTTRERKRLSAWWYVYSFAIPLAILLAACVTGMIIFIQEQESHGENVGMLHSDPQDPAKIASAARDVHTPVSTQGDKNTGQNLMNALHGNAQSLRNLWTQIPSLTQEERQKILGETLVGVANTMIATESDAGRKAFLESRSQEIIKGILTNPAYIGMDSQSSSVRYQ